MYLTDLTFRLLTGAAGIDERRKAELRRFFLAAQTENGGFAGRQGNGDLYYTSFALRGLFLLGALTKKPKLLQSVSTFLDAESKRTLSAVELASFVQCSSLVHLVQGTELSNDQKSRILDDWQKFRCRDGNFASSERTEYSSTYTTFLAAVSFELLGAENEKQTIQQNIQQNIPIEPILTRQRSDGGFVELEKLHQSGTNPTAAAIGFLKIQGSEPNDKQKAADFLLARQTPQGGFQANTRIPIADLLSSFTATVALSDLQAESQCRFDRLQNFLASLQTPDGGYSGSLWDRQSDVEYTFYGLALEALTIKPSV